MVARTGTNNGSKRFRFRETATYNTQKHQHEYIEHDPGSIDVITGY